MTAQRMLPAMVMLGLFFATVLIEPLADLFPFLVFLFGALILREAVQLIGKGSDRVTVAWCAIFSILLLLDGWFASLGHAVLIFAGAVFVLLTIRVVQSDFENIAADVGKTLFTIAYVGLPMGMAVAIMQLTDTSDAEAVRVGNWHLIFLIVVVFGGDSGAYFIGRRLGRRPFFPKISPKKTVEGAAGGVVASVVFAALALGLIRPIHDTYGLGHGLLLGLLLGLVTPLGDLAESAIKRDAGAKDSSHLLAGHGGFLDVFDSLIFGLIAQYGYLQLVLANP